MDYIIAPISADRVVLESTLRYMTVVNDVIPPKRGFRTSKEAYLVWNMVDGREKSELYEVYEQVIAELGLQVLKTFIPDSKRFRARAVRRPPPAVPLDAVPGRPFAAQRKQHRCADGRGADPAQPPRQWLSA